MRCRFFGAQARGSIPGITIGADSIKSFIDQTFQLLSDAAKDPRNTSMRIIELSRDGKVLVAQLADVRMQLDTLRQAIAEAQVTNQLNMELRQPLYLRWFTWEDLTRRLNYQDATHGRKSAT